MISEVNFGGAIRSSVQAPTFDPSLTKTFNVSVTSWGLIPSGHWGLIPSVFDTWGLIPTGSMELVPSTSSSCGCATTARSSTINSPVDLGLPCCRFWATGLLFCECCPLGEHSCPGPLDLFEWWTFGAACACAQPPAACSTV